MSSDVEPIGPPWRDGQHCRHGHPQCDDYGCPLCAYANLLRDAADKSEAEADRQLAIYREHCGSRMAAMAADEAAIQRRIAAARRAYADRIEAGDQ